MSREHFSIWNLLFLLLLLIHSSISATAQNLTVLNSSCQIHCGGLPIPYPFGIGKNCYLNNDKWYEVTCNNEVPFLSSINREVVNFSLPADFSTFGRIQIKNPVTSLGCSNMEELSSLNVTGSPFFLSDKNTLVAVGCNNKALMTDVKPQIGGCESTCDVAFGQKEQKNISCDGYKCCQAKIPSDRLQQIGIKIESLDGNGTTTSGGCRVAFLTDEAYSPTNITEPELFYGKGYATVELGWFIDISHNMSVDSGVCQSLFEGQGGGYSSSDACICEYGKYLERSYRSCWCNRGYRGNPYLSSRCIDVNECEEAKAEGRNLCEKGYDCQDKAGYYHCTKRISKTLAIILGFIIGFGLLVLAIGAWWLYKFIIKQREITPKTLAKRNEGLLLQQLISNEETTVFSSKELEKASEHFSLNNVPEQSGQGSVYKEMLVDERKE